MFTKNDLKNGDVVICRNGTVEIVCVETDTLITRDGCTDIDCVECIREEVIRNFSEADVAKVKHGKWIIHNNYKDWQSDNYYMLHIECSECGKKYFLGTTNYANEYNEVNLKELGTYADYSYCGKCGAKMDGDSE